MSRLKNYEIEYKSKYSANGTNKISILEPNEEEARKWANRNIGTNDIINIKEI